MLQPPASESKRFGVRRRTFKKGKIIYGNNSIRNCQLKDISKNGALLGFEIGFECPKNFSLNIPDGALEGDTYDCEVVNWRDKNMVGVSFINKHQKKEHAYEVEKSVKASGDIEKQVKSETVKNTDQSISTSSQMHALTADSLINILETLANTDPKEVAQLLITEIHKHPEATLAITKDCQKGLLNLLESVLEVTEQTSSHYHQ